MKKAAVLLLIVAVIGAGYYFTRGNSARQSAVPANDGQVYEISIAHIVNEDNTWHKASLFFKEYVEEKAGGRIEVKIYPNNQMGSEMDVIKSIMTDGGADITFTGESMQSVIPELGILGVPYLMRSSEVLAEAVFGSYSKELESFAIRNTDTNSAMGVGESFLEALIDSESAYKQLEELMLEQANMKVLGYFERGPRNVTANKPIRTPDDMKGLVIRVPASPITVAAMEALGAKPTPMASAEVFTSLRQGTIAAQEDTLAMIKTGNFYEVQKYLCRTEHLRPCVYIAMSNSKFESLPLELQEIVAEAGAKMQEHEHELFMKEEAELEDFLKEKGMIFVDDVDRDAFAEKALSGVEKVLPEKIKPLYEQIKAMD